MSGEGRAESCWVEVPSKSRQGKTYYYNKATKQSTWKLPRGVAVHPLEPRVQLHDTNTPSSVERHKERPPALQLSQGAAGGEEMEVECERWGEDEEVEMDVDLSPELMEELLVQISSAREMLTFSTSVDIFNVSSDSIPFLYAEKLYIVLDTNVLISHLQFLVELKDTAIKGVGRPLLIVPWVVMQELDSLKTRPDTLLAECARAAISLLHACFSSRHRRVRGQTVEEVHTEVSNMSIANNDDRILHCCLLYGAKVKGHGGVVVLFTNDINLSAKALVNNITALNRKTLLTELRMLCRSSLSAEASSYTHTEEFATRVGQQLVQNYKEALCDDLMCEAHRLVRDGLAAIAKAEFIEAYDSLWIKLIIVKPPWSLNDLILIFEKHWIAVFGMYVNRSLNKNVTNLKHHLHRTQGRHATFAEIEMFLQDSMSLLKAYAYRSDYGGLLSVVLAKLTVLSEKAREAKVGKLVGSQPAAPQLPPTPPSASLDELKQLVTLVPPSVDDQLPWALNLVTETVKHFFFQLQSQTTDKQQAIKILQQLIQLLSQLFESITSLLSGPQPPNDVAALRGVVTAIDAFLKTCLDTSTPITIDVVFRLVNNESQVEVLRHTQQECWSYINDLQHLLQIITTC